MSVKLGMFMMPFHPHDRDYGAVLAADQEAIDGAPGNRGDAQVCASRGSEPAEMTLGGQSSDSSGKGGADGRRLG
jgi:hypothetical protein